MKGEGSGRNHGLRGLHKQRTKKPEKAGPRFTEGPGAGKVQAGKENPSQDGALPGKGRGGPGSPRRRKFPRSQKGGEEAALKNTEPFA